MLLGMIPVQRLLSFFLLANVCVLALSGCGGSPVNPVAPAPTPNSSHLAGNWLLVGSVQPPIASFNNTVGTSSFVAEFDVVGTSITASATIHAACTSSSAGGATFGADLTGTVAPDGSFSVSTPSQSGLPDFGTLTIQGAAPSIAGGPWMGSYTFNFSNSLPGACNFNLSGPFTASSMADITGTFTGSGTVSMEPSGVATPVTVALTLQQGGLLYPLHGGTPVTSKLALNGSVQVQGISCFTKGATAVDRPSEIDGSTLNASFTMDDGSTLQIGAGLVDANMTQLSMNLMSVSGGQCQGNYLAFPRVQLQR
ncbi:MAG TPA: hypothetical protein VGN16_00395 [Acidobacteriaceae bacterium]|jgi:hypothetical protein